MSDDDLPLRVPKHPNALSTTEIENANSESLSRTAEEEIFEASPPNEIMSAMPNTSSTSSLVNVTQPGTHFDVTTTLSSNDFSMPIITSTGMTTYANNTAFTTSLTNSRNAPRVASSIASSAMSTASISTTTPTSSMSLPMRGLNTVCTNSRLPSNHRSGPIGQLEQNFMPPSAPPNRLRETRFMRDQRLIHGNSHIADIQGKK